MSGGDEEPLRRAKTRLGQLVDDKWRLDALLGVGGMAAVYASTHRNGKRGALKVLHPEVALDAAVKARFLREGYVANKVDHPGAVSVLDDDEASDGTVYLVMELLDGETLEHRLKKGPLAAPEILVIAEQVLEVLAAAHARSIIHRDLKPGNLFLMSEGFVKILDFGIAQLRELQASAASPTTTLSAMGTPGFMPPEQARGRWEEVDARADLWALGATMYTALTGKFVHDEGTLNEKLLAAMTKPAAPIRTVVPDVPASAAEVIDKALAFDKTNRWPDAPAMQAAIRAAYETIAGAPMSLRRLPVPVRTSMPSSSADTLREAPAAFLSDSPTPDLGIRPLSEDPKPPATTNGGSTRESASHPSNGPRAQRMALGGLLAVGAAVAIAVFVRRLDRGAEATAAAGATTSSATATAAPSDETLAAAPSSGTTDVEAGSRAASSSQASSGPADAAARASIHPKAAPPRGDHAVATTPTVPSTNPPESTPRPADSVDIFGRRR